MSDSFSQSTEMLSNQSLSLADDTHPQSPVTLAEKVLSICETLKKFYMTPKMFMLAFLTLENSNITYPHRYWGTNVGWPSTFSLVPSIKHQVTQTNGGKAFWREFIMHEVSD